MRNTLFYFFQALHPDNDLASNLYIGYHMEKVTESLLHSLHVKTEYSFFYVDWSANESILPQLWFVVQLTGGSRS